VRVGVDAGGTFTDGVAADGGVVKVPSTPADPARAVAGAIDRLGERAAAPVDVLAHGTTIATNALLTRSGAPVAFVTNRGFADIIEIGRQDRPSLYDPFADRPAPLVGRHHRVEVAGRLAPDGTELEPVSTEGLLPLPDGITAAAVSLLHSDLNPAHEQAVARVLRDAGIDVCCSFEVSPEFREYERALTTVVNAYLRAPCRAYLRALAGLAPAVLVLSSAGGLVPVADAVDVPASLLLSGPAAGVLAAASVAAANGFPQAISLDMGGTSTDVCLIRGAVPDAAPGRTVAGFPIRLPSLDVHTIGAGGGSIARIDAGGALTVGPLSAGAVPGPACYGRGGEDATVTDADLVLGRIPPDHPLPGLGTLDVAAARGALDKAGVTAQGVVTVVNAAMEQAVRSVTVARGVDPRDCALVAFGGAGPLHACELADALGITTVVVPPRAGVFSAAGLIAAPRQHDAVRSWPTPASLEGLDAALESLAETARRRAGAGAVASTFVDARYAGQSHELTVARVEDFHDEHARRNGTARPGAPIEVVAIRARARVDAPLGVTDLPAVTRDAVTGPAVVAEEDCTIWIPAGWQGRCGVGGALVIER